MAFEIPQNSRLSGFYFAFVELSVNFRIIKNHTDGNDYFLVKVQNISETI